MFRKSKQTVQNQRTTRVPGRNAPVFSYHSNRSRSDSNIGRLQTEVKKSFKLKFVPSFIAVFAILVSLGYVLSLDTNPRVSMTGESSITQPIDIYQAAAKQLLSRSIFSRFKLSIDTKSIERDLLEGFPELRAASITVPFTSRRPIIALEPAEPGIVLTSQTGGYVIGVRGTVLARIGTEITIGQLGLPVIKDESGLELKAGAAALPGDTVAFVKELLRQLDSKGVKIESITLPTVANELHLRPEGAGYHVKFNTVGDARLQVGTYLAVADRVAPTEYIDVRVVEKAFYK